MYENCVKKQKEIGLLFSSCLTAEDRYHRIIQMGRELKPLAIERRLPENRVVGCQSLTYLESAYRDGLVYFSASSDALISAGLAALLIHVYSGESPEAILKCPPDFLNELGISASLTPNRANGLYSMHLRMKQEALKHLLKSTS